MRQKLLCFMLIAALLFTLCGCNMRGDTSVLDKYTAQDLYATFTAIQSGTLKTQVPRTETIPAMQTNMVKSSDYYERIASLYLYNESTYFVTVHGYAWIAETTDLDNAHKAIYFNNEKSVANADYNIRLDPGNNTYLMYEVMFVPDHQPTLESIYFLFFRYEDTEYAAAATAQNEFVFWPLSQTII